MLQDVLYVGIDFDICPGYGQMIPNGQIIIGLSILDARLLQDLIFNPKAPTNIIKSYQFHVGDSKYCEKAGRRFLFGHSESIQLFDLEPRLRAFVANRDIVLVTHGGLDIKILQDFNIDLQPLYHIDTVKAAQSPLRLSFRIKLSHLLETLEVPFTALHAAGNDAHFVLRALLMIAVTDANGQPLVPSSLAALRAVAQAPRPLTALEIQELRVHDREGARKASNERKALRKETRDEHRRVAACLENVASPPEASKASGSDRGSTDQGKASTYQATQNPDTTESVSIQDNRAGTS